MDVIKEIFDKKSPMFIINIAIFITAIVARGQPFDASCIYSQQLKWFQSCLIVTTGSALVLKTVAIQVIKKCCISRISLLHNLIILGLLFLDIGMYVWSLSLHISMQPYQLCLNNQPHHFLIQAYSVLYSLLYVVILAIIASLRLQNKTMTVLNHHRDVREEESL